MSNSSKPHFAIRDFIQNLFRIQDGVDREGTIIDVKEGNKLKGFNAWLLISSIMIASLGLNLNSPAVIIGAMLISPLMGPILGVGMGIGINDNKLLVSAIQNFTITVIITIAISSLFFWMSPIDTLTNEIISRTKPTLLDALVAFFGGIAGIVSGARKDASNALPGVAIATALMPPLCVTGYGLSIGNWTIMANSFYLFFLNAVLVSSATYIIVRFLKFPERISKDELSDRKERWTIFTISLLAIIPSVFIMRQVLSEVKEEKMISSFINNSINNNKRKVVDWKIINNDTIEQIIIGIIGPPIPNDSINILQSRLEAKADEKYKFVFIQNDDKAIQQLQNVNSRLDNFEKVNTQLKIAQMEKSKSEIELELLKVEKDSLKSINQTYKRVSNEVKAIYPELTDFGFADATFNSFDKNEIIIPVFFTKWHRNISGKNKISREKRLYNFLIERTNLDTLKIINL